MVWWNPATWDIPQQTAEFIWGLPFWGDVAQGATNVAIAASINDAAGPNPNGPSVGDYLAAAWPSDNPFAHYFYAAPATARDGRIIGNPPGERGYGWFPEGPIPDDAEKPLAQGLLVAAAVAAFALSGRRNS